MGAEFLLSPYTFVFTLLLVLGASLVYGRDVSRAVVSPTRLLKGYLSVVACCAVIVAVSNLGLHERLAPTLWEFGLISCVSLIGVSLIGLPLISFLERRGVATTPAVLGASLAISVLGACLLAYGHTESVRASAIMLFQVIGLHLLLALSFCLGAGLRWHPSGIHGET